MVTAGNTRSFAPRPIGRRWVSSFPPATTLITGRSSGTRFFGAQDRKLDSGMRKAPDFQHPTTFRSHPDWTTVLLHVRESASRFLIVNRLGQNVKEAGLRDRLLRRSIWEGRAGSGRGRQTDSDTPSIAAGLALNDFTKTSRGTRSLKTKRDGGTRGNRRGGSTLERLVGNGQFDEIMHFAETIAIEMKDGGGAGERCSAEDRETCGGKSGDLEGLVVRVHICVSIWFQSILIRLGGVSHWAASHAPSSSYRAGRRVPPVEIPQGPKNT